jgi:hypothetical protein
MIVRKFRTAKVRIRNEKTGRKAEKFNDSPYIFPLPEKNSKNRGSA